MTGILVANVVRDTRVGYKCSHAVHPTLIPGHKSRAKFADSLDGNSEYKNSRAVSTRTLSETPELSRMLLCSTSFSSGMIWSTSYNENTFSYR